MTPALDWDRIDLVVFDVDGTLYDAQRLRRAMLWRLLHETWRARSVRTLRVLRTFRAVREVLGAQECANFEVLQYTHTAARVGCDAQAVRALVAQWMEREPLPLLRACRHPQVEAVFAGLRAAGKPIGVLSDYPAQEKLRALELQAQVVVSATDADIARLKPHPRGLLAIVERAGVSAARTLMIGDRVDRDAASAQRAGAQALMISRKQHPGVMCFARYNDAVFVPLVDRLPVRTRATV